MTDTSFGTPAEKLDRLAALYAYDAATGKAVRDDARGQLARQPAAFLFGWRRTRFERDDYHRFTQMLLRGGGARRGAPARPRTLRYMTENHLPGGVDLEEIGQKSFSETALQRCRIRTRLLGRDQPGEVQGALEPRRVRLGRCGEHRLLGRSEGTAHCSVPNPANAVLVEPHSTRVEATRLSVDHRLSRGLMSSPASSTSSAEDVAPTPRTLDTQKLGGRHGGTRLNEIGSSSWQYQVVLGGCSAPTYASVTLR